MPPPPPPPPPDGADTGAGAPVVEAFATPFARVGVAKGPFGPVLALLGAGLGAVCPDIVAGLSCTG